MAILCHFQVRKLLASHYERVICSYGPMVVGRLGHLAGSSHLGALVHGDHGDGDPKGPEAAPEDQPPENLGKDMAYNVRPPQL